MTDLTPQNPQSQLTKACSKCGEEKPATTEYFGARKKSPDGLKVWCRVCEKDYHKEYRNANRERLRAQARARLDANRDAVAQYFKEYRARNIDRIKAYDRERYYANREERSAKAKAAYRLDSERFKKRANAYYWANREARLKRNRAYARLNTEKSAEQNRAWRSKNRLRSNYNNRFRSQRRKARKAKLADSFTQEDWGQCLDYFSGTCAACGTLPTLFIRLEMDHYVPLSSPDCPGTVKGNMIPLCKSCNASKGNRDALEWAVERLGGKRKAKQFIKRVQAYFDSLPNDQEE